MREAEYRKYDYLFPKLEARLKTASERYLCKNAGLWFVGKDIVWGNGVLSARIMIVGKGSAGLDETEQLWRGSRGTLIPLTNKKTGLKLRIMLEHAGIDPFSVFFTNVVKCNSGRETYSFSELRKICRSHLRHEWETIKPAVILTLGKDAMQTVNAMAQPLTKIEGVTLKESELVGSAQPYRAVFGAACNCSVFNLKHPSRVEGRRETDYIFNLRAIADFVQRRMAGA